MSYRAVRLVRSAPRRVYVRRGLGLRRGLGQSVPATPDLTQWRQDVSLAAQAGIPVLALKAIRSNESGGDPSVIRFESRIFNDLTNNQYASQPAFSGGAGYSGTGTSLPNAFQQAYRLDPTNAVNATSWGAYQVLLRDAGPQIWAQAGNDPARFIQMFNADPASVSEQILVSWFKNPQHAAAQQAAQQYDWVTLAHHYNGCALPCDTYAGRLEDAYNAWLPQWQIVQPELAQQAAYIAIGVGAVGILALAGLTYAIMRRRRQRAAAAAAPAPAAAPAAA